MTADDHNNEDIKKLAGLFYEKGYRQNFTLHHPDHRRVLHYGRLSDCLAVWLKMQKGATATMDLQTHAPYRSDILCRFRLANDPEDGLSIKELTLSGRAHQRRFRFRHNREVPGAMTLEGFFPKEKPWNRFRKGGDFR